MKKTSLTIKNYRSVGAWSINKTRNIGTIQCPIQRTHKKYDIYTLSKLLINRKYEQKESDDEE